MAKSNFQVVLSEFVYWGHVIVMTAFFFSGFVLQLNWVVLFYILIELQLSIFNGCGVTKLQQSMNDLATDEDFIPALTKRLFKYDISDKQHEIASFVIMAFPVFVALFKDFIG